MTRYDNIILVEMSTAEDDIVQCMAPGPKPKHTELLSIRVEPELRKVIEKLAEEDSRTLSQMARLLLINGIPQTRVGRWLEEGEKEAFTSFMALRGIHPTLKPKKK